MFQKNIINNCLIIEHYYGVKKINIKSSYLPEKGKITFPIKDHGFDTYGQIIYKPGHTIHYIPTQGIESVNNNDKIINIYEFPWFRFRKSFLIEINDTTTIYLQPFKLFQFTDHKGPLIITGLEREFAGIHCYLMDFRYLMNNLEIELNVNHSPKNYIKHIIIEGIQDFIIFYLQNIIDFYHANDSKQIRYLIESERFRSLTNKMTEKYISNDISITQCFNNMMILFQNKFLFPYHSHRYNINMSLLRMIIQSIISKINQISQSLWFHIINLDTNQNYHSYIKEYKYKISDLIKEYNIVFDLSEENIYDIIPCEYRMISFNEKIYSIINEYKTTENNLIKIIIRYILSNIYIPDENLKDICNNYLKEDLYLYQNIKENHISIRWKNNHQIFQIISHVFQNDFKLEKVLIQSYIDNHKTYENIINQDDYIQFIVNIPPIGNIDIYVNKYESVVEYNINQYSKIVIFLLNKDIIHYLILPQNKLNDLNALINNIEFDNQYIELQYIIISIDNNDEKIYLENGIELSYTPINDILNEIPDHFQNIKQQLISIIQQYKGIIKIDIDNNNVYLINVDNHCGICFEYDIPDFCSSQLRYYKKYPKLYSDIINKLIINLQSIFLNNNIEILDDNSEIQYENINIENYFASCKINNQIYPIIQLPINIYPEKIILNYEDCEWDILTYPKEDMLINQYIDFDYHIFIEDDELCYEDINLELVHIYKNFYIIMLYNNN